jgi:hypothetical protein
MLTLDRSNVFYGLQKVKPMSKTAQQILDDFIREMQLEKGRRVVIAEITAHASNWEPVIGNTSDEMIERYATAFLALRTLYPVVDWSGVNAPSGRRALGGDGIF